MGARPCSYSGTGRTRVVRLTEPQLVGTALAIGLLMKSTLNIFGVILVLFGGIWFLQGINVLPGSFMTGQTRWAIYGGIAVVAGIVLLVTAKRLS